MIPEKTKTALRKAAKDALAEFVAQIASEESTKVWILKQLNMDYEYNILQLVGLERAWDGSGELRLDHCNGRLSTLDRAIESVAREAIVDWVKDAIGDAPKLTASTKNAIKKQYNESVQKVGMQLAKTTGEQDARKFFAEMLESDSGKVG